jgi:hypothetical protein
VSRSIKPGSTSPQVPCKHLQMLAAELAHVCSDQHSATSAWPSGPAASSHQSHFTIHRGAQKGDTVAAGAHDPAVQQPTSTDLAIAMHHQFDTRHCGDRRTLSSPQPCSRCHAVVALVSAWSANTRNGSAGAQAAVALRIDTLMANKPKRRNGCEAAVMQRWTCQIASALVSTSTRRMATPRLGT